MNHKLVKKILKGKRSDYALDEIEGALSRLDEVSDWECDILLIKNLENLFVKDGDILPWKADCSWRWYGEDIITREYPLEGLPEHVRELARELYYEK